MERLQEVMHPLTRVLLIFHRERVRITSGGKKHSDWSKSCATVVAGERADSGMLF